MKSKNISTFGYIVNYLNIKTSLMAKSIHVDSSLISKWKSGQRHFNEESIYFNDVVSFIMNYDEKNCYSTLKIVLTELYPDENISDENNIETILKYALCGNIKSESNILMGNIKTIPIAFFTGIKGQQEAIMKLFDSIDEIETAGNLTFIDTLAFKWIWSDADFSKFFTNRLLMLLNKGYHAVFVMRYSSVKENFRKFFDSCSPIIFNKNVKWYYVQYYDEPIAGFSLILYNHTLSMIGMFAKSLKMTTMVFKDREIVLNHSDIADEFINKSLPLFSKHNPFSLSEVISNIQSLRIKNDFYAFLPIPAIIATNEDNIINVLKENKIDKETVLFTKVLKLNSFFRNHSGINNDKSVHKKKYFIFQIEKLIENAKKAYIGSNSLSLACNKNIRIRNEYFANELKMLAKILIENDDFNIALVSEKDNLHLPNMNCWCLQDGFLMQMRDDGFYISEESTIISTAFNTLERCIHKIPPERRDKQYVSKYLIELADEIMKQE